MEQPVIALVDGLLDAMAAKGVLDRRFRRSRRRSAGRGDRHLLAVPREERRPLRDWSLAILARSSRC